jgi:hypothetical protein
MAPVETTPELPSLTHAVALVAALGSRLRLFLAHRDFLVIEILIAFTSLSVAAWLLASGAVFSASPYYEELARLAPQWGWAAGSALCFASSVAALVLDATESPLKVWARVGALALHAGLFAMLGLGILLSTSHSIAPPILFPLVGACINGSYKVRLRASP